MTRTATILVERLGAEHAQRLAHFVGGTSLSVPAQLGNVDRLTDRLSRKRHGKRLKRHEVRELVVLIVLHFGGLGRVYVPSLARASRVDANEVRRLSRQGWSAARIARHLGCSERSVYAKRALKNRTVSPRKEPIT